MKKYLRKMGLGHFRYFSQEEWLNHKKNVKDAHDLGFLRSLDTQYAGKALELLSSSQAQLFQDVFVLLLTGLKKNGYFVEFGATNGFDLSNTYLLEKEFGWNGILAEPAKIWHNDLKQNRSSNISLECVWSKTGEILEFDEANSAELSTISSLNTMDLHSAERKNSKKYQVSSISLNDLLKKYDAPKNIDYISIDTEGSEFQLLEAFDFNYNFSVITVEHNYTKYRSKIHDLLTSHGYHQVMKDFSDFDDWYVNDERYIG